MLSGLLAALMLFTAAAVNEGVPAEQKNEGITVEQAQQVSFQAVFPENTSEQAAQDAMERAARVFEMQLPQFGYEGSTVTQQGDTLLVSLPAGADAAGLLDALNAYTGLTFADESGRVWLGSAADYGAARVVTEDVEDAVLGALQAPLVQVELTEQGARALAEASEAGGRLLVTLGGEPLGEISGGARIETDCWNIAAGLSESDAAALAARVNAGALPVPFRLIEQAEDAAQTPAVPAEPLFDDMSGHWAEQALQAGVQMGLLKGIDGRLLPNNTLKRAEAVTMLVRALGATEQANLSGLTRVTGEQWYAPELAKGIYLGLIDADDSRDFDAAATRGEAFVLLSRAFVFARAADETNALAGFTDTAAMSVEQKQAAAALAVAGIINGSTASTLSPDAPLTRAEFVTMLTRVVRTNIDEGGDMERLAGGALLFAPETTLADSTVDGDLVFPVSAAKATLDSTNVPGRVVVKGAADFSLTASGETAIGVLALDPAGSATVKLKKDAAAHTLLIAGQGGKVSFSGEAANIEITASGREIDLGGMKADTLTVTGSGNRITLDGTVGTLLVAGRGTVVDGHGKADAVDIRAIDCKVGVKANSMVENIDPGLAGVGIEFGVPNKVLPGGALNTLVRFTGVDEPRTVRAVWYQDGAPIPDCANDAFVITPDKTSYHTTYFTFTKDMKPSVTMGFQLLYENPSTGRTEEVFREITVPIENYSDDWYYQRSAERVLGLVSSTYRGNFTAAYAIDNDYQPYEKEIWVNAKGYSSKTEYLVWINRAYQHVNVFTGSKGNWKLDRSFLVGTGAMSSPTPVGVTTVSYKSAAGWTTGSYTVRPVVGFYPGTGYAFHSRLCYPGTDREYDFSSGYPVSHGCVRMKKPDIQWIYDTIPVGTTVVIH